MQNFFMDHCQDAFGCMSEILGENFNFKKGLKEVSFIIRHKTIYFSINLFESGQIR